MEQTRFCCGQIPTRKKGATEKKLPENPSVANGTAIIYLGAGDVRMEGKKSGLTYYVSDHRRRFKAESGDVSGILDLPHFILEP
jgi:hypothetical protein